MFVPVMLVVKVGVRVRRRIVKVLVLVALGEMQPDADAHERPAGQQRNGQRLAESNHRCRRAENAVEK